VGPEGGLTDHERELAVLRGLRPVSLGSAIMRSETAGIVGVALALSASGDLG
jgi:16S rRNA (uracil1498-N3)-methyltransferase